MMKKNLIELIDRLKDNLEMMFHAYMDMETNKSNRGKLQSARIRLSQHQSRTKHLTNQLKNILFSGNMLEVKYIAELPDGTKHKYQAVLTDVSQKDFEYFIQQMNRSPRGPQLSILEIQEIPTFIREVPL